MAARIMSEENATFAESPVPVWPAIEQLAGQLLTRALESTSSGGGPVSVLITTLSRGQAAAEISGKSDSGSLAVDLYEFEHYRFRVLCDWLVATEQTSQEPFVAKVSDRLRIHCGINPPTDKKYQVVVLCVRRDWGAELTRDLLQCFADRVTDDGQLIVVVDHPDDSWIGEHLRSAAKSSSLPISKIIRRFMSAQEANGSAATGYMVAAESISVRHRDFTCQFAFRHEGKLLQAVSRPGVFAHRKLDLGARRLMDAMEIGESDKVLDIGCGSGVVSFAVASTSPAVLVTAIDSNMRAIECTRTGAVLNQLESQITTLPSSDGSVPDAGIYDVALGNPPYFANFHIAELFLQTAHDSVRPGGKIWFVAKQPEWYRINVLQWFDRVKVTSVGGGYCIATGIRPQQSRVME